MITVVPPGYRADGAAAGPQNPPGRPDREAPRQVVLPNPLGPRDGECVARQDANDKGRRIADVPGNEPTSRTATAPGHRTGLPAALHFAVGSRQPGDHP
jgi:hypothetical protein